MCLRKNIAELLKGLEMLSDKYSVKWPEVNRPGLLILKECSDNQSRMAQSVRQSVQETLVLLPMARNTAL